MELSKNQQLWHDVARHIMGWHLADWTLDDSDSFPPRQAWVDDDGEYVMERFHWCPALDHDFGRVWARMRELTAIEEMYCGICDGFVYAVWSQDDRGEIRVEIKDGQVAEAIREAILWAMLAAVEGDDEILG